MEIVTADEMRRIDRYAIRSLKIPSRLLMECAGLRVAESVERRLRVSPPTDVIVICGKGNNGGDGLIAARLLTGRGWGVAALLAADPETLTRDAAGALREAQGAGVSVTIAPTPAAWRRFRKRLRPDVLVLDALLGTGLSGGARGLAATIIEDVVASGVPVIAVDLPSGLSGDTAEVPGPVMTAQSSIALCRPKIAHLRRSRPFVRRPGRSTARTSKDSSRAARATPTRAPSVTCSSSRGAKAWRGPRRSPPARRFAPGRASRPR
jgi:hydroxyethylthiazole kinase-like uncharacterized protein yjeF